jgi:hypothetical protein
MLSRDWADIDCKASSCKNNRDGSCLIPSKAELNEEGKCKGFSTKTQADIKAEKDHKAKLDAAAIKIKKAFGKKKRRP